MEGDPIHFNTGIAAPMPENLPNGDAGLKRGAIDAAPAIVRRHGLQDVHTRPLVGELGEDGEVRTWRTSPSRAWHHSRLELRTGSSYTCLILDVDEPLRWLEASLPGPNWIVTNGLNQHCHVVYTLAAPVHRYPEARPAPLLKLSRIADYYTAMAGDRGYNGVLTRNPLPEPDLFTTTDWLREAPFSLDELSDWIPKGWRAPPVPVSAIGKNVTMFRVLVRWAGYEVNADRPVLAEAVAINATFHPDELPYSEIRATAASVERIRARWAANGWHKPSWVARQSARGVRSGKARRAAAGDRDRMIVELSGAPYRLSRRAVAGAVGCSPSTVQDVLRRERKGVRGSQHR